MQSFDFFLKRSRIGLHTKIKYRWSVQVCDLLPTRCLLVGVDLQRKLTAIDFRRLKPVCTNIILVLLHERQFFSVDTCWDKL